MRRSAGLQRGTIEDFSLDCVSEEEILSGEKQQLFSIVYWAIEAAMQRSASAAL